MNNNIIENWPNYNTMVRQLENLDDIEYDDVCELEKRLIEFQQEIRARLGVLALLVPAPLEEDIAKVSTRRRIIEIEKSEEAEHFYLDTISGNKNTKESEVVNGFNLYDCDYNLVDFPEFIELKKLWVENEYISDEEMLQWINKLEWLTISWALVDKNGKLIEIKGKNSSMIIENIKNSLENNIQELLKLPYPRKVIQFSVLVGKNTPYDSPRYCNFFCEWVRRKIIDKFMYREIVQYINNIYLFFNGRNKNKYMITELVDMKYGHMFTFYQLFKMIPS